MVNTTVEQLSNELSWVKQDCLLIRNAVTLLEQERDSLRQGVRKLKLENTRMKEKMKNMQTELNKLGGNVRDEEDEINVDYDELGRDFLLVGGKQDPFAVRYEVSIRDSNGIEHRTVERYIWYKMAELFEDAEAQSRIQQAANTPAAETAAKEIKGFDQSKWNAVKLQTWIDGQQLKLDQVRWIANLLVESKKSYIAVADQDKVIGTGWRKNRDESNKPIFWDGENQGGRWLMQYRKELIGSHVWAGPYEEQTTQKKYGEMKKFVWRRIDQNKGGANGRGGHTPRGGGRGGRGMQRHNNNQQNPTATPLQPFF